MNIDLHIIELRKKKELSQEELAKKVGVSRQAVAKWESGVNYPELENIKRLCEIFEISTDELINGKAVEKEAAEEKETNKFNWNLYLSIGVIFLCIILVVGVFLMINKSNQSYNSIATTQPISTTPLKEEVDEIKNFDRFSFSNCNQYVAEILGSAEYSNEEISALQGQDSEVLQSELNTFVDCLAFFDSYNVNYYSLVNYSNQTVTAGIYRGYESRINISELNDAPIYSERIGFNVVSALTSYYLMDNYENSGYIIMFTGVDDQFDYIILNYFYIDGKYCIVGPESNASYSSGEESRIMGKKFVYFEVDSLSDVAKIYDGLLFDMCSENVKKAIRVDAGESVFWGMFDDVPFIDGGEVIYDAFKTEKIEYNQDNIAEYMSTYQSEISTIDELFEFCKSNNMAFAYGGDIETLIGNDIWHYNKTATQVVLDNEAVCGSFANLASFMLEGDYEEVGQLGLLYAEDCGGGHVISYIFDGNYYYVYDLSSCAAMDYYMSNIGVLKISSWDELFGRLDEVPHLDASVVKTIISYTDENDMPIIFGNKTAIYPQEADINVVYESKSDGYSVSFKSLPNYQDIFNRDITSVENAINPSDYSDDYVLEDYILNYQEEITTVKEYFDFCKEKGFTYPDDTGDITYFHNLKVWHYNRCPRQVILDGVGGCGSFSNMASFMLEGDYQEVGQIAMTSSGDWNWGGHVISYVYDGSKYYVFDTTAWANGEYSSSSYKLLTLDSLDELKTRMGEIIIGDASAVVTIISYTYANDIPVVLGETVYYPEGCDINIIKESPEIGSTIKFEEFDNYEDILVRNVPHYE